MEPVAALEEAFAHTGRIISNISPDQMSGSTPCTEWDRFNPAVDAPDASPTDQFAAFLGRPV